MGGKEEKMNTLPDHLKRIKAHVRLACIDQGCVSKVGELAWHGSELCSDVGVL